MARRDIWIGLALGLIGGPLAFGQDLGVVINRPYDAVRADLIAHGLRPVGMNHGPAEYLCAEDFCVRYPEVIDCGGSGPQPCRFAFERRDGGYVVVTTQGRLAVAGIRAAAPSDLAIITKRR